MGREVAKSPSLIKPSQLDFTQSNQPKEPVKVQEYEAKDTALYPETKAAADLSEPEQKLWLAFEEILKSKNDSDPRVRELTKLGPAFRMALFEKYNALKPEDRNGRGFIVFLVSRDLQSAGDLEFLQKVYQESPCLSLQDCASSEQETDPHNAGVGQTTLIYPQLVALYQIEKQLNERPELLKDPAMRAGILATLKQAEAFPVPAVHDRSVKIRNKYNL